ncbi:MAG: nuclear transport factor 2 family protein [Lautropia sp.]
MTHLILPQPIAAYFAADKRDPEAIARCFAQDATVIDEGRTHVGRAAIEAWKAAASSSYTYTVEPFAMDEQGGLQIVRGRVAGNFPGSPVDLRYRFRIEGGVISSLEITA